MSIATAITNAQGKVANAYTAISNKGGTLPATQNLSNMPTAISSIPTSGGGTITSLSVTPTTSQQTITASGGVDGYSPITVSAVTSSIDNNITASNIKNGVIILGVQGTYTGGGITPTGTLSVTANGTYGVDSYAYVDVAISGGSSIALPREISAQGVYQVPTNSFTYSLPNTATALGNYALSFAFYSSGITSLDLSNLTEIKGTKALQEVCADSTNLTSIDFSNVTTIEGNAIFEYAFYNCTGLTSVDLPSVTEISGYDVFNYAFSGCSNISSVDFSSLVTIGKQSPPMSFTDRSQLSYAFYNCTNLTSLSFPQLIEIYCSGSTQKQGTFAYNNKVQKMYFPKLTTITYKSGALSSDKTACKNIFYNCSSLTELHFGAANQSAIEATLGYSTLWGRGAGNATVYFDL